MKNFTLFIVAFLASINLLAQDVSILDFENNLTGVTATAFESGGTLITNPVSGGINTSANVYEITYTDANQFWGGVGFAFANGVLDDQATVYKAKLYSTTANSNVLFELEVNGANNPVGQVQQVVNANEWVEVTFTLPSVPPAGSNRILIRPDIGTTNTTKANTGILYVDDIVCTSCTLGVPDVTPPVITLLGDATVNLAIGDPYTDAGATASDDIDGDISGNIVVGGDVVDTGTDATFTITYNVMDAAGNAADEVTRTVIVGTGGAIIELPLDFELAGANYIREVFGGGSAQVAVDPEDAGNNALEFIRPAGANWWSGGVIDLDVAFDATIGTFSMDLYSTIPLDYVELKLEQVPGIETIMSTTHGGTGWETLTFDTSTGTINGTPSAATTVVFTPRITNVGGTNPTVDETYYIDNIKRNILLPLDFELTGVNYIREVFGGGSAQVAVDPEDAGNNALEFIRPAGANWWSGGVIDLDVPFDATSGTFEMDVYSTIVLDYVELKLEQVPGIETIMSTTHGGTGWETLTFDTSTGTINGTPSAAATVVFTPRITNVGGTNPTVDETYYFDNIAIGAGGGDTTPPVITLLGDATVNLAIGDPYTDAGATASDDIDGDISGNIVVGGDVVDTGSDATFTITYNVMDAAGNAADEVTRTVIVGTGGAGSDLTLLDFENSLTGVTPSQFSSDGALNGQLVSNPVSGGINTSPNVYQINYQNTNDWWGGVGFVFADGVLDAQATEYKAKLYSTVAGSNVLFQVEQFVGTTSTGTVGEVQTVVNANEWVEVTFTIQGTPPAGTNRILIRPDVGAQTGSKPNSGTLYIDDIVCTSCDSGSGGGGTIPNGPELVVNGGFEDGLSQTAWEFLDQGGTISITDTEKRDGTFSALIEADVAANGGAASFPVLNQLVFGENEVNPGDKVRVTFNIKAISGVAAPVYKAALFSNFTGSGAFRHDITFPEITGEWQTVTADFTTDGALDPANGLGIQFQADCGANPDCSAEVYIDNVSAFVLGDIDTERPVITLTGSNPFNLETGTPYAEPGFTATDNIDGNLTANVVVSGDVVDENTPGTYEIRYNVVDAAGNEAIEASRFVVVGEAGGGGGGGPITEGPNLLNNPSFEDNSGDGSGWLIPVGANGTASVIGTDANDGTFSVQLLANPQSNIGIKQEFFAVGTVLPNKEYALSFDTKVNSLVGNINAAVFSEGAGAVRHDLTPVNSTVGVWVNNTFTFTTAADVSGGLSLILEVVTGGEVGAGGDVLVDNFSLQAVAGGGGGTPTAATFPIDFEVGGTFESTDFVNFNGGASTIIDNPDAAGINTSAKVVQMQKFPDQVFGGTTLNLDAPIDYAQGQVFKMKVWSPREVAVTFKLEFPGSTTERVVSHSGSSSWEELTFDFSAETGIPATSALTIIFDNGTQGAADTDAPNWTFYYDDIIQEGSGGGGGPTAATFPVDFEVGGTFESTDFVNFNGGASTIIDNPDASGINTSAKVVEMQKFPDQVFGGTTLNLDAPIDYAQGQVFKMKVWSPREVAVTFKLEFPGSTTERVVSHSGSSSWEELTFDFSAETGIPATSALTIIFDNGTQGAADTDAANWTFYYDDISQSDGSIPLTPQTITFDPIADKTLGDAPFNLSATSDSGLDVTFSSTSNKVTVTSAGEVTLLAAGSVTIDADQAGDATFEAAPTVSQTFCINPETPTITESNGVLTSSSATGNQWFFNGVEIAGETGQTLTFTDEGSYTVQVTIDVCVSALSAAYVNAAPEAQTITFGAIADKTFGDQPFSISATASSGLDVTFSSTSDNISITDNTVTLLAAGRATIDADQAGNADFTAAPTVAQSFCVNPEKPVITISDNNSEIVTLSSSIVDGNQWFLNSVEIENEIGQNLEVTQEGIYTVQVTVDDCISELSDEIALIVTGTDITFESDLLVYPNPATDLIQIKGFDGDVNQIQLFDISGRKQLNTFIKDGDTVKSNIANIPDGVYMLIIRDNEAIRQLRIIKN